MCGRFEVLTAEEVAAVVAAVERRQGPPGPAGGRDDLQRLQVFPGSEVVLLADNDGGRLADCRAIWGFEAPWGKKLVFNTRIESALAGAGMWKDAAREGRCVIPAASFYEPHATETVLSREGKRKKRSYRFSSADGNPLLMAGMRDRGRCSVVTCEPNRWVAPVHPRMPLILRFEEIDTWLGPNWTDLAHGCNFELHAEPEHPSEPAETPAENNQLSLF